MLSYIRYNLLLFIAVMIAITACKKDAPAGPAGPDGKPGMLTGSSITGYLELYNEYGVKLSSYDSVIVRTQTDSAVVTDTTDAKGFFELKDLTAGNYNLRFYREGYDSLYNYVIHAGGNEPKFTGITTMNKHLSAIISNVTYKFAKDLWGATAMDVSVVFTGTPATYSSTRRFVLYFGKTVQTGPDKYDSYMTPFNTPYDASNQLSGTVSLSLFAANGIDYKEGDTVYMKTVLEPFVTPSQWLNYQTGQWITYPYAGNSLLIYFIWPKI